MKSFDFDRVKEVRIDGLFNFELVVDAHQDGDASSVVISGSAATSVDVQSEGGVVSVHGQDAPPARGSKSVSMTGMFITGNVAIPVVFVPKEPLRVRYGDFGEAPVTIEVALPPGQRVVLHGPFQTVTTAAPRQRAGEVRSDDK